MFHLLVLTLAMIVLFVIYQNPAYCHCDPYG